MSVTQEIKNKIFTITGKRRLTILQKFIDASYKRPEQPLRNVPGEYSPKQIINDLRLVTNYLKALCANNGRNFTKYYSYEQIGTINTNITALGNLMDPIQSSTGQNALRSILYAIPTYLEALKNTIGPFSDMKPTEVISELTEQVAEFTRQNDEFEQTREQIKKDALEIQANLQKSRKLKTEADTLLTELSSVKKEFNNHESIAKEILQRIRSISSTTNDVQKKLEKKISALQEEEEKINNTTKKIETSAEQANTFTESIHSTSTSIDNIKVELEYLTAQARHSLNISHGAGIADSYRKLEKKSKNKLPRAVLLLVAALSFVLASMLTVQTYYHIRLLSSFAVIFQEPVALLRLLLIPALLILFFACVGDYKRRLRKIDLYSSRVAALESFLHVSDRLPYDSPEKINTANYIFNIIRSDFSPQAEVTGLPAK